MLLFSKEFGCRLTNAFAGTATQLEEQRYMLKGIEFEQEGVKMKDMESFIKNESFAKHLGIKIINEPSRKTIASMEIKGHHLNSLGTVHGGAIFSLADIAFGFAANSKEGIAVGINVSISYFKAIKEGTLYAEVQEVSVNPKLATYIVNIKNEDDDMIALFQGTVYRKKDVKGG